MNARSARLGTSEARNVLSMRPGSPGHGSTCGLLIVAVTGGGVACLQCRDFLPERELAWLAEAQEQMHVARPIRPERERAILISGVQPTPPPIRTMLFASSPVNVKVPFGART